MYYTCIRLVYMYEENGINNKIYKYLFYGLYGAITQNKFDIHIATNKLTRIYIYIHTHKWHEGLLLFYHNKSKCYKIQNKNFNTSSNTNTTTKFYNMWSLNKVHHNSYKESEKQHLIYALLVFIFVLLLLLLLLPPPPPPHTNLYICCLYLYINTSLESVLLLYTLFMNTTLTTTSHFPIYKI